MNPIIKSILAPKFIFATLRVMTPILYPAIGVAVSALAGSVNIALEGIMLVSAFTGVIISAYTGSLWFALIAGVLAGVGMGAVLGYFHLNLKADIIIAAIALNMFASGITIFLLYILTHDKGTSSSIKSLVFPSYQIPLLKDIPVLGPMLSGHNILTYLLFVAIIAFYYIIYKTPLGLRIRAVGQNPEAAASVGIDVKKIRMYSLLLSGFFGSFGGLYLSMGYVSWFSRDMTAGRGFIAIAAASLGGNLPLGTFLGAALFGLVNAFSNFIAPLKIPSEFMQSIPYLTTVIVLAIYSINKSNKEKAALKEGAK
ncbi:MAG: ABC transporter permease [Spirochaetes bacterium]|nr:MAG: ABC transporter permease [Spirochaetota bacterium]